MPDFWVNGIMFEGKCMMLGVNGRFPKRNCVFIRLNGGFEEKMSDFQVKG